MLKKKDLCLDCDIKISTNEQINRMVCLTIGMLYPNILSFPGISICVHHTNDSVAIHMSFPLGL